MKKPQRAEPEGPPEERILVGGRLRSNSERARLERSLESTIGEFRRRRRTLHLKEDCDWLELDVDAEFVRARFSGKAALHRWFPAIRHVASEYGLVEPD